MNVVILTFSLRRVVPRGSWPQELGPREAGSLFGITLVANEWFRTTITILSEGSVVAPPPDVTTRKNGS